MAFSASGATYLVIEIILIVIVATSAILMRKVLTPFTRGFFKDDDSLMYPFKPSSVTNVWLYVVGFIGFGVVVVITEGVIIRRQYQNSVKRDNARSLPMCWMENCYRVLSLFAFGAALTHLVTNIGKYSVGRLRPHFFAVCMPDWSRLNDTSGYILEDICTGPDKDLIKEARVSFPSGHSSISMYCGVFLFLYLLKRFTWKKIVVIRPLLQLVGISLALYTCLTRISDYKHHWSDVIIGAMLGAGMAFFSMFWIHKILFANGRVPETTDEENYPHTYLDFRNDRRGTSDVFSQTLPDTFFLSVDVGSSSGMVVSSCSRSS
ncbi:phospholipid phosphatase 2 [Aplysia californica]|uniref:Phospholipid phosphatase 2 n=1 Tax=Aplysia californica TaxID=6500 RepID=A0ABM0K0D3_APLCA|nr:phospholipid phosphatase 2 [Aplysia californica]